MDESGCWVWQGHYAGDGYAGKCINLKTRLMHRLFYRLHKGEIPKGLVVDHLCRNKRCVNPEHLEAKEQKYNARRGINNKLSEKIVKIIRAKYRNGISQSKIAKEFGVTQSHISRVISGDRGYWI